MNATAKNNKALRLCALVVAGLCMVEPASAHHAMGGTVPNTALKGLLSGLAHPVIGFDHLAFVVAVGIASAFCAMRFVMPALFVAATLAGCLLALSGAAIAQLELVIAASVALIGVMLLSGRSFSPVIFGALFVVAGLFHGAAYAGSIVGAETTPLGAYLLGFGVVQYAIAAVMTWITAETWQAATAVSLKPRLAGAVIAGVGATFLVENVEKLLFAGL